jgi:hypothetical protein
MKKQRKLTEEGEGFEEVSVFIFLGVSSSVDTFLFKVKFKGYNDTPDTQREKDEKNGKFFKMN